MPVLESLGVAGWLYGLISGDTTLQGLFGGSVRVYLDRVPSDSELADDSLYPFVTMTWTSGPGGDTYALGGGKRVWTSQTWLIAVYGLGNSYNVIGPIAARLDDLIQTTQPISTSDVTIYQCLRRGELPPNPGDTDPQRPVKRMGATYDLIAQQT